MTLPLALQQPETASERIVLDGGERRKAIVSAIGAAKERVRLSMFRCTDFKVMDSLGEALERKVNVELLLTQRAKGWEKKIRELGKFLESMGAQVYRYDYPGIKYHAKYLVVDEDVAIVTSGNLTLECFEETQDFMVVTRNAGVVGGLSKIFDQDVVAPGNPLPAGTSPRLIVGPDNARKIIGDMLRSAKKTLRIVDHKIQDVDMIEAVLGREKAGVDVKVYGRGSFSHKKSHGKLTIVDGERAMFGSIALSPNGLSKRRELAIVIDDPACVRTLAIFLDRSGPGNRAETVLAPKLKDDDDEDDDE